MAWNGQGHELMGSIADTLLEGTKAGATARGILGVRLADAAKWPDCVRSVRKSGDEFTYRGSAGYSECDVFNTPGEIARMVDYARRNWTNCAEAPTLAGRPCHALYHFSDVALQRGRYDSRFAGTADVDIVHAIDAAVAVLEEKPTPAPFSIADKKEALLMLAHFAGDLTQPLHVGAVWLSAEGSIVDPDAGGVDLRAANTRGGNSIRIFGSDLHTLWDHVPTAWGNLADDELLSRAREIPLTSADIGQLAAAWAGDTVRLAPAAIAGLTFGPKVDGKWTATPAYTIDYRTRVAEVQRDQVVKAGARLAELLRRLWP